MVTDDLNRNYQTDWVNYTITAPSDPRLPGGGGYPITVYLREHHGGDAELPDAVRAPTATAARSATPSTTASTSTSTPACGTACSSRSARRRDAASTIAATSSTNFNNGGTGPNPRDCRDFDPWQTTIRGLGSYTIPKVDVLVSATVRSQPPLAARRPTGRCRTPRSGRSSAATLPPGLLRDGQFDDRPDRQRPPDLRGQPPHAGGHALREGRSASAARAPTSASTSGTCSTRTTRRATRTTFVVGSGRTWAPESIYPPRFVRLNFTVNSSSRSHDGVTAGLSDPPSIQD